MGSFSRSVALLKSSWGVLRQDKELMLLPLMSSICAVLLMAPFLVGVFLSSNASTVIESTSSGTNQQVSISPVGWVLLFIGYLVVGYVGIFFQAALVLAANDRMTGGSPTLGSALRMAGQNAGRILPWAVISATVSVVIKAIQQRAGIAGRLVGAVAGVAWAMVTLLVVPILVIEHVGVKEALTRSGQAFKRTWGENMIGNGGIGLVSVVGVLGGFLVFGGLGFAAGAAGLTPLVVAAVVALVLWIVMVAAFTGALNGVFRTALYRFAVLGEEPMGFTHDQIAGAFHPRGRSGR